MTSWRPGHPSVRKLHQWTDGQAEDLDRHLATCEYCADRLEASLVEADAPIRSALLQLLTIPDELPDRLCSTIDEHLANRRELSLIGEFFGLPLRTARVISSTDQGDD